MSQVSLRDNGTGVPDQSLGPSGRKQRRLALLEHSTHRDEHSAAGEERHEFNEHRTSFQGRVIHLLFQTAATNVATASCCRSEDPDAEV
jgi:hypothetical protein